MPGKFKIKAVLIFTAVFTGVYAYAATVGSNRPNILLIINDDIGLDVNTNTYPGLIEDLVEKYGPAGQSSGFSEN